jgi:hypothetical protein
MSSMTMQEFKVTEKMKKSAFSAKNRFEYKKLIFPESYLIRMTMEEEKEELVFHYEMKDKKTFVDIRAEDILNILAVLMSVEQLKEGLEIYITISIGSCMLKLGMYTQTDVVLMNMNFWIIIKH